VKQWDKRFGGRDYDWLQSLQQTKDGGYMLGGDSFSDSSGNKTQPSWGDDDDWIVKLKPNGNKQWDKRFGGTNTDFLYSMQQTNDGGYILGGSSASDSSGDKTQASQGNKDYWIVKIDSLGNKQWDKTFGGSEEDGLIVVKQTIDGGYILGGYSKSPVSGDKTQGNWDSTLISEDFWVVKTDSFGNKQWDKTFGGDDSDTPTALLQSNDNGYLIGGISHSDSSGDKTQPTWDTVSWLQDYWIVKIDSLGNKQWDKDFGGTDSDDLKSLQQAYNGGYFIGGFSESDSSGNKSTNPCHSAGFASFDYWIVKIDSLGNKQWDKSYGGGIWEFLNSISLTTDGGLILAGISDSDSSCDKSEDNFIYGNQEMWIVKTDSLGNKQWDKTIFTKGDTDYAFGIQTNDQCYVLASAISGGIAGYKTQSSQGGYDYWIIKFCDTTLTTSINQIPNSQSQFSIYPNPTNAKLNLTLFQNEKIVITNLVGEIILQEDLSGKVELDVSFLSAGIYFIKAGNAVRKFIKE
jgi:hypothetical protein